MFLVIIYFKIPLLGEELKESVDAISVAANEESAISTGGSADQNKNQLALKSWWMSNTQIKKEKGIYFLLH